VARLACIEHKARVLVLESKTIHRSGGETCKSLLKIGDKKLTANEVRRFGSESGVRVGLNSRDSII
jgi:hypothetical protein